ncbi:MAG: M20/M25/M40 family metallo-hydrolase, partial [Planctomycetota bacterium]
DMTSGAGHDSAVLSDVFPTSMLFIRQPVGISHHPDEDVDASDVAIAIEVLHHFVTHFQDIT